MAKRTIAARLQLKLWLSIAAALLLGFVAIQFSHYRDIRQNIIEESLDEARGMHALLMATRRVYHQQFLDSELPLTDKTLGFLPAHALSLISQEFSTWDPSGRSFNNVSLHARNPDNRADALEAEAIRYFVQNPTEEERLVEHKDAAGRNFLHYAKPIWTEAYCLECHGSRADAPAAVRARYDDAFDYEVGQLRGILSIRLPRDQLDIHAREHLLDSMRDQLLVFAILFIVGGLLLQRFVISKLDRLKGGALALAGGDYQARVAVDGQDELADLASAFNQMAGMIEERDSKLRATQAYAKVGYWSLAADSGDAYWSPEIYRILGLDSRTAAGPHTLSQLVHPDDATEVLESLDNSLKKGTEHQLDYRIRRPDGEERWVTCRARKVTDAAGAGWLQGFVQDITERKHSQLALQQSEERFALAMEGSNDGVFDWNLKTNETYYSPRYMAMLGYAADELAADFDTWERLTAPEDREASWAMMRQYMAGERHDFNIEFRMRHKQGHWVDILARAFLIRDESGEPVRVVGTHVDISSRRAAQRALQEERNFLQNLIDSIDDPILVISPQYDIMRMNRVARELADDSGAPEISLKCHRVLHRSESPCSRSDRRCPLQEVLVTGEPCRVVHEHNAPDGRLRTYELAVSPLRDEHGEIVGIIEASRDITEHLELLAELEQRESSYAHLAQHDPLTGLPNRVLFADRLAQAIHRADRRGLQLAVLFLDLDRFKQINDSFDHSYGDQALQAVARRLERGVRQEDTIARMGGDEFTFVLSDIHKDDDAGRKAREILRLFEEPFTIQGHPVFLGASIGISMYPRHGQSADELVRNADAAMYRAKESGRNTFHYYTEDLTARAFEMVLLEASLHHAVERNELVLHYQPQLDLLSGALCGFEALVRWQHPEMGLVPPVSFIPLAEASGMILPMGEWILGEACRQMQHWLATGIAPAGAMISVNLSARQFDQVDLVKVVASVLEKTALPSACLELEITESTMMKTPDESARTLGQLRALGVKVAIDDFGTGYSSLNYLKRLPLTKLKIDQSFVSDIPDDENDMAIVRAVIALARSLSLEVLAEGIETREQQQFLAREGCHIGQGYLLSRPIPADDVAGYAQSLSEPRESVMEER